MSSFGVGLGSSKKGGRVADSSMVTRNLKLVAQGQADATYSSFTSSYTPTWGVSWTKTQTASIFSVDISSATGQYQVYSTTGVAGVKISEDYGNTWRAPATNVPDLSSLVAVSGTGQYMTATSGSSGNLKIYRSTNYGQDWALVYTGGTDGPRGISMSTDGQYHLCVGDSATYTLIQSSNYGASASWFPGNPIASFSRDCDMSGSGQYRVIISYDGYVYMSSDYGATWGVRVIIPPQNSTVGIHPQTGLCISSTGQYVLIPVIRDFNIYSSVYLSQDYGVTWSDITSVIPLSSTAYNFVYSAMSYTGQYMVIMATLKAGSSTSVLISSTYGRTWSVGRTEPSSTTVNYELAAAMSDSAKYIAIGNTVGLSIHNTDPNTVTTVTSSKKNVFRLSSAILNAFQYNTQTLARQNMNVVTYPAPPPIPCVQTFLNMLSNLTTTYWSYNGVATSNAGAIRVMNNTGSAVGSAFYKTPVNVSQPFAVSAIVTLTIGAGSPVPADGFAVGFATAPNWIGAAATSVGFVGSSPSVLGVGFTFLDFTNNYSRIVSTNSESVYDISRALTNTSSLIIQNTPSTVRIAYDGANVTWSIQNGKSIDYFGPLAIDLNRALGGSNAYLGVTAGSGGSSQFVTLNSLNYTSLASNAC